MNDDEINQLFNELSNVYSFTECQTLQPFHPDLQKLHVLGKRYIYDFNIIKLFQCYGESLAVAPEEGIKDMNRLLVNFNKGRKKGMGATGSVFLMNDSIIVKAPVYINFEHLSDKELRELYESRFDMSADTNKGKNVKKPKISRGEMIRTLFVQQTETIDMLNADMQREFIIGLLLNKMRNLTPNFIQTFGAIYARLPRYKNPLMDPEHNGKSGKNEESGKNRSNDDQSDEVLSVAVINKTGLYLLLEYVEGKSFYRMVSNWFNEENLHAIFACFLQIFYTVWLASDKFQYVHGDLHAQNIMVQELDEPVHIPYILPNNQLCVITTPFLVRIFDYGYSSATVPNSILHDPKNKGKLFKFSEGAEDTAQNTDKEKGKGKRKMKGKRIGIEGFNTEEFPMSPNLKSPLFDIYKILFSVLRILKEKAKDTANYYLFSLFSTICDYIPFFKPYVTKNRLPNYTAWERQDKATLFGSLTKTQLQNKFSLSTYNLFLEKTLLEFFKINYLTIIPNRDNLEPNSLHLGVKDGQIYKAGISWYTCNDEIINRLKKAKVSGEISCWRSKEAREQVQYSKTMINMTADYLMRYTLSEKEMREKFPDIDNNIIQAQNNLEKELNFLDKPQSSHNLLPAVFEMRESVMKLTMESLDFLRKKYSLAVNKNIIEKVKRYFLQFT